MTNHLIQVTHYLLMHSSMVKRELDIIDIQIIIQQTSKIILCAVY
jgi:hypothetical protein